MDDISLYRNFLKDSIRKKIDFRSSDQNRGVPVPPAQQPVDPGLPRIDLPDCRSFSEAVPKVDLAAAIGGRKSRRRFSEASLTLEELAFLLWATQGRREPDRQTPHFRCVPSAGARHSFETYLYLQKVETLAKGLYRYLPLSHQLVLQAPLDAATGKQLNKAVFGQHFVAESGVVFIWTTVPYRMEWRYLQAAHRVILLDAGHVCQNLYLACEAIGAGTCAVAAYDQEAMDALLGVDGEEQFTIYLAPVGKVDIASSERA